MPGHDQLIVVGVLTKQVRRMVPEHVHHLRGNVHEIGQGLADYGVQGDQQQHGDKAPQAAAGHAHALILVKLLDRLLILGLIAAGVLGLQLLQLGRQPGHFHGAFLALDAGRQQDHLQDNGENHQGHAIVGGQVVQPLQQIAKGHSDDVPDR